MSNAAPRLTAAVGALVSGALTAGCQVDAQPPFRPDSAIRRVEAPLTDPMWASEHDTVVARAERPARIVKLTPDGDTVDTFGPGVRANEGNALIEQPTELLCVPQPWLGHVSWVDTASFDVERIQLAGAKPAQVVVQPTSKSMLALSLDHETVTGTDLETYEELFRVELPEEALAVDTGSDTRDAAFWVIYPGRVVYYAGDPPRPDAVGYHGASADTFSPDRDEPGRAYVAGRGGDEVVAADKPEGGELQVVDSVELSHPVEFVESKAKDEFRVYVVTSDDLVIMESQSLDVLAKVDLARLMERHGVGGSEVAGMTVGDEYVYLTLDGEPFMLKIEKP